MRSHQGIGSSRWAAFTLFLLGAVSGCSDATAPESEALSSFRLTGPTLISAGETIPLTIEAVGSQGTVPFVEFSGDVTLTASAGTVTPNTVALANGRAAVAITLSAADGIVQVSGSVPRATGSIAIDVSALVELPGDPTALAFDALPELAFGPRAEDYSRNPDLSGLTMSHNTFGIRFKDGTSVAQANALLATVDAILVGTVKTPAVGVLILRTAGTSHEGVATLIATLRDEPVVDHVVADVMLEKTMQTSPLGEPAGGWSWESPPAGGNWGLELSRVPQMWNLNPAIEKLGTVDIGVGILDRGFSRHDDLRYHSNFAPAVVDSHGTHVAGTIAGGFDNKSGIDGIMPYAALTVWGCPVTSLFVQMTAISEFAGSGVRVINFSLGSSYTSHPASDPNLPTILEALTVLFLQVFESSLVGGEPPLLVLSAGNESAKFSPPVPAKFSGAAQWAGLEKGSPHILVVEALELDPSVGEGARLTNYSSVGGDLSAAGSAVLSTVNTNDFTLLSGTSMAAPHVAGLAAYLLGVDPSLSNAQLRTLLTLDAVPVAGSGATPGANRMDAFSSAMNIDHLTGDFDVAMMLLDIDDGTLDGNLRVLSDDPSTDFTDEDADQDGGVGDGTIDMSDFRRWRDWCHQVNSTPGAVFDGSPGHAKFDVNGNGQVEDASTEEVYPRADFNGDGFLDDVSTAPVAGVYRGLAPQTDVDVIALLFDDEHYTPDELYGLVDSGDILVDGSHMFDSGRFDRIVSRVTVGGLFDEREFTETELAHIYTVPSGASYEVQMTGFAANGDTLCAHSEEFAVAVCQDHFWKPACTGVHVELNLAETIALGETSPVLVRAGIIQGDGTIVFQSGIDIDVTASGGTIAERFGTTDVDGFYSTEVTMGGNTTQLNVFATASSGGESAVARATAVPPADNSVTVFVAEWSVQGEVFAGIRASTESDADFVDGSFLNEAAIAGNIALAAGASDGDNSASATADLAISGSATWDSPGVLSALSVSAEGGSAVSVTGPFTESYAASARSRAKVEFEFNVAGPPDFAPNDGAARFGVQLIVMASQGVRVNVMNLAGGGFEVVDSEGTFDLVPGGYRISFSCGANSDAEAPPYSESATSDGDASIRFAELPAVSTASQR